MPQCIQHCRDHSNVEMEYLTGTLTFPQGTRALLARGAAIQLVLRGRVLPLQVDRDLAQKIRANVQEMRNAGVRGNDGTASIPTNFRVFPKFELNEDELKYSYLSKKPALKTGLRRSGSGSSMVSDTGLIKTRCFLFMSCNTSVKVVTMSSWLG
jgi:hypothetical protein